MLAGLRLAVGTLTMVPVGDIGKVTKPVARQAMTLAPLAALPLAVAATAIAYAGEVLSLPSVVTAGLVLGALAWGSRGMHLDGFADTIDGFAAGWSRDRALEVMRKGDVGPLGASGLIILLLVQVGAITAAAPLLLGWAVMASRWAVALVCRQGIPAARPSGLGAVVAGTVPTWMAVVSGAAMAAAGAGCALLTGTPWWLPVLAVALGGALVAALTARAVRLLGGVTGDIMGAAVEVLLTTVLVVLAVQVS